MVNQSTAIIPGARMNRPIPVPFQLNVSHAILNDLRAKLTRVRATAMEVWKSKVSGKSLSWLAVKETKSSVFMDLPDPMNIGEKEGASLD